MNVKPKTAPRISKGAQPSFFSDPATEAMYGMMVVLMEEVCVLRDRLDTYERLGATGTVVTPATVDDFEPDRDVEAQREHRRRSTINRIMRPVKALQEAAVLKAQVRYHEVAERIAEQEI